jgi:hypothetical protein
VKEWIEEILVRGYLDPRLPLKIKAWTLDTQARDLGYQSRVLAQFPAWDGESSP